MNAQTAHNHITSETTDTSVHIPVLYREVLDSLQLRAGGRYIDATLGGAGHAQGILTETAPDGALLALDADPAAIARGAQLLQAYSERVTLVCANFGDLQIIAHQRAFYPVDGVLFDLGFSSFQLADAERGFSLRSDGPLDMRFSPQQATSAAELVNRLPEAELARILWEYGEERFSRRIARAIVAQRPLHTTGELTELIVRVMPRQQRLHPATRTFQALRIAVNDELQVLRAALAQAVALLAPWSRLVVISFHSLEDRIVKHFFLQESRDCICPAERIICACDHRATLRIVTKKPLTPQAAEREANPRSRSAKLRVAYKLVVDDKEEENENGN